MLRFNFKDEIPQGGNRLYNIIDKITGGIIQQNCMIQRSNGNDQDGTAINALLLERFQDEINYNTPIGVIHEYAGSEAPTGYLLCQGQEISRTTYADLFQVIGTTYGSGDGSTTFHIPDMRGRVVVGLNSSDTDFNALGKQGGSKTHTLSVDEMPSHTHTQNAHKHTASGSSGEAGAHGHSASSNSTGAHTHTVSGTATSGGSHAHNTWKVWSTKYTYGTYDIIMTGAPADGRGNPTESAGAHTHTVSGTAASGGSHSHTITVNSSGAHTHTVSVTVNSATAVNQLTGGGLAHNNMQPYLVLNYIIKY